MIDTRAIEIGDPSGPAEARRTAAALAAAQGFDVQDIGRVALVVTEVATNVYKHARTGTLVLSAGRRTDGPFFQTVAIDSGPGFDLRACLADGHSTAGTPGSGLGAIDRLSETFDAYSPRDRGSVVFSEIRDRHAGQPAPVPLVLAGISVPKEGEEECGDAWTVRAVDDTVLVLVVDGIGHGPDAARAARAAVKAFEGTTLATPAEIVELLHNALRPTRGATIGVAALGLGTDEVRYVGVGNIAASIAGDGPSRHLVSHNGTAGREMRKIQEFRYPWQPEAVLVMASDGVSTRWDFDAYPGLASRHPAVVAGVLYRDFGRRRDDATVVVGRRGAALPRR